MKHRPIGLRLVKSAVDYYEGPGVKEQKSHSAPLCGTAPPPELVVNGRLGG